MYKTVWISTTPRTGSMWVFNVTRQLLKTAGYSVLPSSVPQLDEEMLNYHKKALEDENPSNMYCLKIHGILHDNIKNSKIITTIRDPRDICLSFRNFMKCDFEEAFEAAKSILRFVDVYERYNLDYICFVKYEDLTNRPIVAATRINEFLKLNLSEEEINESSEKYSKANVIKIVDEKRSELRDRVSQGQRIDSREFVVLSENNYRAFDAGTGFQTGHISENKPGDWRNEFSEQEKNKLGDAFGEFCQRFNLN